MEPEEEGVKGAVGSQSSSSVMASFRREWFCWTDVVVRPIRPVSSRRIMLSQFDQSTPVEGRVAR